MIDFKVQGMTCGGCVRGVTNALQRVDADAVVNVDLASKTVSVSSAADVQQLKQAIEKAGFVVTQ
ncbi:MULTISPECIES: heavy-metal-associated domain-containing protein [Sphingomonadales]|jgi:copper chaperone|uniref:Copper chaperone n=2 Tax=Sphingomonadales TaxID=204457 RepID=A0A2W5KXN8_SPHMC|nr:MULTISPECIES: heavy-metal-associated domain-containing protein [Sphingomonadales]MAC13036.1 heavy metal transporter [Sphingorhabdus sp.]MAW91623.1 heavy metal transporter [Altererythrobacter sp.]OYY08718.1 MAG: heavy metal transporter [Sphingobacteriia bacterium 35-36-14]PZQ20188.1 MAG: copper chaperone [Sphingopyxis macrogoltabida]USA63274.1 heavy-metal-associated domain-containing protein [Qipengyuania citrea]|tara:strand:+ start:783 stop:977 length:195 start_codon:yes stop_codon:yes gene_type:complete